MGVYSPCTCTQDNGWFLELSKHFDTSGMAATGREQCLWTLSTTSITEEEEMAIRKISTSVNINNFARFWPPMASQQSASIELLPGGAVSTRVESRVVDSLTEACFVLTHFEMRWLRSNFTNKLYLAPYPNRVYEHNSNLTESTVLRNAVLVVEINALRQDSKRESSIGAAKQWKIRSLVGWRMANLGVYAKMDCNTRRRLAYL